MNASSTAYYAWAIGFRAASAKEIVISNILGFACIYLNTVVAQREAFVIEKRIDLSYCPLVSFYREVVLLTTCISLPIAHCELLIMVPYLPTSRGVPTQTTTSPKQPQRCSLRLHVPAPSPHTQSSRCQLSARILRFARQESSRAFSRRRYRHH
jgi:hypothetical protein